MTEKGVHAGQSNIRLGFVIAAPVRSRRDGDNGSAS